MRNVSMLMLVVCLFTSIVRPGEFGAEPSRNAWIVLGESFVDAVLGNASAPLCALDFDNDGDVNGDDLVQFGHTLVP
ncbi:MAG TPA: hypothetical protein VMV81_01440 [Phycisphaerae bacterium]|nr:hypothetical protein [Phycisphaerae bacterium]